MKRLCIFFFISFVISNSALLAQDHQQAKIDSLQRELDQLKEVERLRNEILYFKSDKGRSASDAGLNSYDIRRQRKAAKGNIAAGAIMAFAGTLLLLEGAKEDDSSFLDFSPFFTINGGGLLLSGSIMFLANISKMAKLSKMEQSREVKLEINGAGARVAYTF